MRNGISKFFRVIATQPSKSLHTENIKNIKMKIAVIGARSLPAKLGGIERYCQELYPQIVARGHEVDLYVQPSYHQKSWFSALFSTFFYQKMKVITLLSLPGKRLSLLNSAFSTIWATFGNYDVIHLHGMIAAWFTWFPQLFSNSSVVVTFHQLESSRTLSSRTFSWLLPWLEKMAVKYADEIVVTNHELADYFFSKYGVYSHYIPHAPVKYVTEEDNHYSFRRSYRQAFGLEQQSYLLYLGSFEPDQRLDLLIKVFQQLQPPNWKLVLAGDICHSSPYSKNLLKMARKQENIVFTGDINGNLLAELVRDAGVFVEPSEGNNLSSPIAMLEAMREGVPILASDTITHRQLLGRDRGLLFRAGQFDSLLVQLEYVMSRPNLLAAMTKKAQTYIAVNHNWDKVIYKNLFLYLQLTAKIHFRQPHQT
jgi:glycosyltransferase involved in cell wall biosynthesis